MTTSAEVLQFRRKLPAQESCDSAADYNAQLRQYVIDRLHLAEWLRDLASLIEADRVEVEPRAAQLVMSGVNASEVLHIGYGRAGGPTTTDAFRAARDLFNNPGGGQVFCHATRAASPSTTLQAPKYRLLEAGEDTIEPEDEFLRDDATTWARDPGLIRAGMKYSRVLRPARRRVEAGSEPQKGPAS